MAAGGGDGAASPPLSRPQRSRAELPWAETGGEQHRTDSQGAPLPGFDPVHRHA